MRIYEDIVDCIFSFEFYVVTLVGWCFWQGVFFIVKIIF
jgi:hypothetical protein